MYILVKFSSLLPILIFKEAFVKPWIDFKSISAIN